MGRGRSQTAEMTDRTAAKLTFRGFSQKHPTSNITRMSLDFRIINRDFGGFGSELRTDVRVGFLTQFATEYYRQLGTTSFLLQPHAGNRRTTCRLWTRRLCDRRLRSWRCMVAPDPHHVSTGWRGGSCGRHAVWSYYDRRFCWRR